MEKSNNSTEAPLEVFAGRCPARPGRSEYDGVVFDPAEAVDSGLSEGDLIVDLQTV